MNATYPYLPGYDSWKLSAPDEPSPAPCRNCPKRNSRGTDEYGNTECDYCEEASDER